MSSGSRKTNQRRRALMIAQSLASMVAVSLGLALAGCGAGSAGSPAAPPAAPPTPPIPPPPGGTSSSSAAELPFTGQLNCFDGTGTPVACGSAAGVPVGQDGAYASGRPSLSRFRRPAAQADCMVDALTGLTWPVAADSIGALSWSVALTRANELVLCGHDDWRLPTRRELRSLISYGEASAPDWLTDEGFVGARSGRYWSATSRAGNPVQAWALDLATGRLEGAAKTTPLFVWPVRGGTAQ